MRLAILVILVTAALLAGAVECVASCAAVTVESPCRHHKSAPHHQAPSDREPGACSHELVLDRVHAPVIGHGFEARGAMQTAVSNNPQPNGWGWNAFSSDLHAALSCHRQDAGASLSLRI